MIHGFDQIPHRGLFDRYTIQRVQRTMDDGEPVIQSVEAFGYHNGEDKAFYTTLGRTDRIDNIRSVTRDDVTESGSVGVVPLEEGRVVEIMAGYVGRDELAWWGRERDVYEDNYDPVDQTTVQEI